MSGWWGTIATIVLVAMLLRLAWGWWPSPVNPVMLGLLAWLPALVMLNWPPFFLGAYYAHFNLLPGWRVYGALVLAFFSFWGGCALMQALLPAGGRWPLQPRPLAGLDPWRALVLFAIGLPILLYAWALSGLAALDELDPAAIAEGRRAVHLGPVSFLVLLMDLGALALFAHGLRRRRLIWGLPLLVAMAAYSLTLQKFTLVWLAGAALAAALLQPRAALALLWGSTWRRLGLGLVLVLFVAVLFVMNDLRGMSQAQLTAAASPLIEQVYIYSGASAIMNLWATMEGLVPADMPAGGRVMARVMLWTMLDPAVLEITRHFGGVNTGTWLLVGWADFRWAGLVIMPFVAGVVIMLCVRVALRGSFFGLVLGALAVRALIFSPSTDKLFEPTTTIFVVLALGAGLFIRRRLIGGAAPLDDLHGLYGPMSPAGAGARAWPG